MPRPSEAPHSIAERFLAQSESTAIYGGKTGETIKELRETTRTEIASILDHEAARLFNKERQKAEKKAKHPLRPDEIVAKGSNLEAVMHLALLFKDEEGNEEITHNQQAAAFKVLQTMNKRAMMEKGFHFPPLEDERAQLGADEKERLDTLMRLQEELFTNITGWAKEDFFDQEAVERQVGAWKQSYEQTRFFAAKWFEKATGIYAERVGAEEERLKKRQEEEAEEKLFAIAMARFMNAQGARLRGYKKELTGQAEIMASIKRDLAQERAAMYAEVLTGEKRIRKDAAREVVAYGAENADGVLQDLIAEESKTSTMDEAEVLALFGPQGQMNEFMRFIGSRGGIDAWQRGGKGIDAASLFELWLEWISYLVDLKNR